MKKHPHWEPNRDEGVERLSASPSARDEESSPGPVESSEVETRPVSRAAPPPTPDTSSPRVVLVADDDEPIAEAIALLLEDEGYQPVRVTNGKEAIEAARARWPDLVLTDFMMPRMSGAELIAALRALATAEGQPMPPVVLMTAARTGIRGKAELEDAGVDAVISKPFDVNALVTLISRLLDQGRSR